MDKREELLSEPDSEELRPYYLSAEDIAILIFCLGGEFGYEYINKTGFNRVITRLGATPYSDAGALSLDVDESESEYAADAGATPAASTIEEGT